MPELENELISGNDTQWHTIYGPLSEHDQVMFDTLLERALQVGMNPTEAAFTVLNLFCEVLESRYNKVYSD